MSLSAEERKERMRRYAEGAARLKAAWAKVPEKARQWRPAPGKWSAHEIVCHCADSEANGALRIRYVLAEKEPVIVGYDQDEWARAFDYHAHPVELALQTVEAVRANTAALLARLPESAWSRAATASRAPTRRRTGSTSTRSTWRSTPARSSAISPPGKRRGGRKPPSS
jgi:DinB superfamily